MTYRTSMLLRPILVLLLTLGGPRVASAVTPFPVASTGDIWFQVDQAGFLGEEGQIVEEYYFRVTNNQLQFAGEDGDGPLEGAIYVNLKFRDAEGEELGEAGQRYEFRVDSEAVASSPDYAQLLVFREALDPRTREVEIEVEDLNARKRGLLYMFSGKRKNGRARALITPPPFREGELGISDLQFAWEVRESEHGDFDKHGLNVIPNPSRSYGLLQNRLSAYYEVYDLRDAPDGPRTYVVRHELQATDGTLIRSKPDTVTSATGNWIKVLTFDLSHLPTGEHILRTVIDQPESGIEAVSERPFSLIWQNEFWEMSEQDLLDEARVLFREDEYARFKEMSAGDRAQYVQQFWADQDPTPRSVNNELREEFLRRVAYANRQFSVHGKGMLTDRGRIYIRFGEPDEITREVLPTQANQLTNEIPELTKENATGKLLATNDAIDTRPYEIWTYTRQGTPLFPEREKTTSVTGLKFVFVDEVGTGHYVLRYSSDFIGY